MDDALYQIERRRQALEKVEEMLFEKQDICQDLFDQFQIAMDGKYNVEKSPEQNFVHASVSINRDTCSRDIMAQMQPLKYAFAA